MATRWSSDYNVIEVRDCDANKMAVDYTGCIVFLAGHEQYGFIEIHKSANIINSRPIKYPVYATEWNPSSYNQHICAFAYNNHVQLLCWENGANMAYPYNLTAHTRTVLDLNWHPSEPTILASSSIDTFVYIWDIRAPARPAISLTAFLPASKLRWNHMTDNLLATAHSGNVKIWDQRKASHPLHYISAHFDCINCLDWSYTNENQLVTSSCDSIVKFFEINNLKKPESVLDTVNPVWSVKCTPFGNGILIVLVPPEKNVDNNLLLWNLNTIDTPVHTFIGHTDTILEFQWMKNNEDTFAEHELITWSKDQTLRCWNVVPYLQEMPMMDYIVRSCTDNVDVNCDTQHSETSDISSDSHDDINVVNFDNEVEGAHFNMSSCSDSCGSEKNEPILNLHQEFLSLNVGSEVFIEQKDPDRRVLIALVKINNNSLTIHMTFPLDYPVNVEPRFQISKCTYDEGMKKKIHKVLYDSAVKQVAKNLTCVQYCLHELVIFLRKNRISFSETQFGEDDKKTHSVYSQSPSHYERSSTYISSQDSYNMLQHKNMGLKFCNNGSLLWFNTPPKRKPDFFPSLALQKIDNTNNTPAQKLQPFWFSNKGSKTDGSNRNTKNNRKDQQSDKPIIAIYDVSCLFPINKDLAIKYELDITDVFKTCLKNAWITNGFKRKDLVQAWTLAAYACNINCDLQNKGTLKIDQINSWKNHPFTTQLIDSLIHHYASHSDFQTAALLCCVFNPNPAFKNIEQDRTPTPVLTRSNSLSEGFIFSRGQENTNECFEICDQGLLLEDSNSQNTAYYDEYKKMYIDVLDNLGLLDQQASVKKFLKHQTDKSSSFVCKFVVECIKCKDVLKDGFCHQCQLFNLKCSLCNSTVRGAAHVCLKCGHGGHADHLIDWFSTETLCALRCGCCCLFETMSILHVKKYDSKDD
ncbi:WD40/YVTN repeat-like-containing domain,Ubiquitin-conjugating enzyme/RWD-like,WD40-repeat- [Cinara cedri]|uniref:WD40/YVTN repeat-like-containing domain,Ubiquitin-conjugating enzyme/RWD-like,WD40-repeat n=1 Tax=Cinara cedri TaxID=506608 RepID=A0A5E4MQU3_9HEMI|nr:WD40/YVTN repeat-like-containing domain,Ubiquitin-conjugating enzyme/RWD-like,WD40-repeat- [Cinara cedri]